MDKRKPTSTLSGGCQPKAIKREEDLDLKKLLSVAFVALLAAATFEAAATPLHLRNGDIEPSQIVSSMSAKATPAHAFYFIQFQGPVLEEWKSAVKDRGVILGDYIPEYAFVAEMTPEQVAAVKRLGFVGWVGRVAPEYRIDQRLLALNQPLVDVVIKMFPGKSPDAVKSLITGSGGFLTGESLKRRDCIRAKASPSTLDKLSRLEEVMWIEHWVRLRLANNVVASICGAAGPTGLRSRIVCTERAR